MSNHDSVFFYSLQLMAIIVRRLVQTIVEINSSRILSWVSTVLLLGVSAFLYCQDKQADGDSVSSASAEMKFKLGALNQAMLPVTVYHENANFLLDTGSTITVIDAKFKPKLGAPIAIRQHTTVTGSAPTAIFAPPELLINPAKKFEWKGEGVVCTDFSSISETAFGGDLIGILGMDFLRDKVVRWDFDDESFTFAPNSSMGGSFVEQIRFAGRLPQISARVPDEGFVSFMIDTGGFGSSLTLERKIFNTLVRKGKIVLNGPASIVELNRESSVQRGVLETFELGPHRFHNLSVSAALSNSIESDFLERFTVELDFPKGVARFRPGKQVDAKELSAPLGFSLVRKNGKMLVRVPNDSSLAAKAGIRTDDEILGVNDLTANELTPAKLLELRRIPGKEMRLRLVRDAVQREVVLQVPENPDPFPGKPPHEVIVPAKAFDE